MKLPFIRRFSLEDVIDAFSYGVSLGESTPGCPTSRPASKADVEKAKEEIIMKVSELKTEVPAIKAQIIKVSVEQQARFDALSAKIAELEAAVINNDPDLPVEVTADFAEVKTLLQQLDDTIIDTAPPV